MRTQQAPWDQIAGRIQRRIIRPPGFNPHIVALGQTRSGKDHMVRYGILPVVPLARAVLLKTKPGTDRTWEGWGNLAMAAELQPGFGRAYSGDRTPRYRISLVPGRTTQDDARRLLEQLAAEGEMIVIVGDAARLTDPPGRGGFGLEGLFTHMMNEGAGNGLTVIACANSSAWAAAGIKDQSAAVLIGRSGGDMRDNFAAIAGLDRKSGERKALDTIAPHWWLYSDHVDGELYAAVATPPAAGQVDELAAWRTPVMS